MLSYACKSCRKCFIICDQRDNVQLCRSMSAKSIIKIKFVPECVFKIVKHSIQSVHHAYRPSYLQTSTAFCSPSQHCGIMPTAALNPLELQKEKDGWNRATVLQFFLTTLFSHTTCRTNQTQSNQGHNQTTYWRRAHKLH